MLARQRRHGVNVLNDKLTVRYPELHVRQIVRIKARLLHRLVERVEQGVVRLVDLHALIRQRGGLRVVAQDEANGLLVGLQRVVGVLPEQPALPLRPQPDHAAEGNQAADQGINQPGDNKLFAVQRKQLQGVYRRHRKAHHRPAVIFADNQVAHQRDRQHACQGIAFRHVEVQRYACNDQPGHGAARPVQNTHPRGAVAVLGDEQHGH